MMCFRSKGMNKQNRRKLLLENLETRLPLHGDSLFDLQGDHYDQDGTLRYDQQGLAYYHDEVGPNGIPAPANSDVIGGGSGGQNSPPAALVVPVYHSNPTFTKKLYLDFDGHTTTGTYWNNKNYTGDYNTGNTINSVAYSLDSDLNNFSSNELSSIQTIWAMVAEDFAPFQVDVTTEEPPLSQFSAGGQALRVVITTNTDSVSNKVWYANAGGVAYLNSWEWTDNSPVWVFYNMLGAGYAKYVAEAASHESGHAFDLSHDGRISPSEGYYQGHGSGQTGWAPIMGVGYYRNLAQWSKGEYTSANNTEDDLQILSTTLGYAADDHGGTFATSTQLAVGSGGAIAGSGLITTRTDTDAFKFFTQAGNISINVDPFDYATGKNNLDVQISLVDSTGTVVETVNPTSSVNATLSRSVAKGYYALVVDGIGKAAVSGDQGYSDYGSIGKYALSGTVVPNTAPVANPDTASTSLRNSVLIDVLANDTDPDSDTISLQSVGSPSSGTALIESGKVRFTPASNYSGQVTIPYTIVDQFGATALGSITVTVFSEVEQRGLYYAGATGSSAQTSLATDKTALLPGQASTYANYTNYVLGLNRIVLDVMGLPASTTSAHFLSSIQLAQWNGIDAGGFAALPAAAIPSATIQSGAGTNGSSRVLINFPNNTVQNTWLRVTVLANAFTGLNSNDVFYFGNVIGDLNVGNTSTRIPVDAQDTSTLRAHQSALPNSANVTNIYDLNRDGSVDAQDTSLVRANQRALGIVAPITAPSNSMPAIPPVQGILPPSDVLPPTDSLPGSKPQQPDSPKIATVDTPVVTQQPSASNNDSSVGSTPAASKTALLTSPTSALKISSSATQIDYVFTKLESKESFSDLFRS